MPLYSYHCAACDIEFEEIRPADETEAPLCPTCGHMAKRCPVAVHYKTNPFPYKDQMQLRPAGPRPMGKPGGGCGGGGSGFS